MARAWRWLTGRATLRPRRITVAAWLLIFLFSRGIDRLLLWLARPLPEALMWALITSVAVLAALFAWTWWSGRDARRTRRSRGAGG